MRIPGTHTDTGPRTGWAQWAEARAKRIAKPRRLRTVNDKKLPRPEKRS